MRKAAGMRKLMMCAVMVGAIGVAAPAHGATTIGQTFTPTEGCGNVTASTFLITASPAPPAAQYAAPARGVITAWSHEAAGSPDPLRLKVGRSAGGGMFTIVGESELRTPAADTLNTYPVRISVLAGDVIGLAAPGFIDHCVRPRPGYGFGGADGDQYQGSMASYTFQTGYQFDISARLEPDADGDGFGDETQDQCPTSGAVPGGPCPDTDPPETTITKGAPSKTKKSKVKFKFVSDEPGSTFACKKDKKPWKPCSSPTKMKRLREGKHKFKVRAIDPAGNVGAPDKDKFKVVG